MLRKGGSASSMQKTYDECYLICSTAIYFEGQNNESEALRAWRNALDQIYYHNAYKMPSNYQPRSETEKALHDSLRSMELQCKERVDLLEALRKSRVEAEETAKNNGEEPSRSRESLASLSKPATKGEGTTWMGGDFVPPVSYGDLARTPPTMPERRPAPPPRPSFTTRQPSGNGAERTYSFQSPPSIDTPPLLPGKERTRTPSPEKKSGGMLKTLRPNGSQKPSSKSPMATTLRTRPPTAAARAATQVWPPRPSSTAEMRTPSHTPSSSASWDPYTRQLVDRTGEASSPNASRRTSDNPTVRMPSGPDFMEPQRRSFDLDNLGHIRSNPPPYPDYSTTSPYAQKAFSHSDDSVETTKAPPLPPPPPPHRSSHSLNPLDKPKSAPTNLSQLDPPPSMAYMKEFPNHPPAKPQKPSTMQSRRGDQTSDSDGPPTLAPPKTVQAKPAPAVPRKAVGRATGVVSAIAERQKLDDAQSVLKNRLKSDPVTSSSSPETTPRKPAKRKPAETKPIVESAHTPPTTDDSQNSDEESASPEKAAWDRKVKRILKNLPKGVDEAAAKQIFNEIVIHGDEVHWDDVAGLENAKKALKETVVYPFLRPDLFMGLREPARGMLLFGPPGTGKTMLARAVATESKSVFFAISASSLTSKFLGESEKLVRALFALAKALAPSIIFVDEIDSLLGSRGGSSEHEATRRIKTEFLIGWSDLQKAAAGREDKEGDASRVLVLAATNLPWAIDEAARRRFVRRQYIPLPEDWVREEQLHTLLAAQKHNLKDRHLKALVQLTDGYSGSDITALAKDAAMGPLRSLGEKLLYMQPEDIRGIRMEDFEASLVNIRPSVSKAGLKEFEDWASQFGERGG
ncbi:P-loop containing nucleoside triphosphate hydrolase protein [Neohortaea acidophila]|uniref:P-loop containing nucleoside triphosphate hydrolase protein n=1 Tax=Neohortaea acidophila TaxID=245834 RepID=A0A6A6PQQ8_9PEZI|nr:P-loop containing nucleoside triphosphate hydrolase protein [Neohortaea acidophila]KAF2481964.1 P-loop containing nucleoside triphosphate hydrolase protein [Neohortaea acidophila]